MDIELLSGSYKSIKSVKWSDIPKFVVVTGKNGSGKTQLLELINYVLGTDERHKSSVRNNPTNPFHSVRLKVEKVNIQHKDTVFLPATWTLSDLGGGINASSFNDPINHIHQYISGQQKNENYAELAAIVEARIGKPKTNITLSDIQNNLPIDYFDYVNKIQLHEGLNEAVYVYHCKYAELREDGVEHKDIKNKLGPAPWDVINSLLEDAHFKYRIRNPRGYLGNYSLSLYDAVNAGPEPRLNAAA